MATHKATGALKRGYQASDDRVDQVRSFLVSLVAGTRSKNVIFVIGVSFDVYSSTEFGELKVSVVRKSALVRF